MTTRKMNATREVGVNTGVKAMELEKTIIRFDGCYGTAENNFEDQFPNCGHVIYDENGKFVSAPTAEKTMLDEYWHKNPLYRMYYKITGKAWQR
jgi:hypothetical protein